MQSILMWFIKSNLIQAAKSSESKR